MNFQTAAKAVELKHLIDVAHQYLPEIGRSISLELEFRREHMPDDEDDDEDDDKDNEATQDGEATATLAKIQDKLVTTCKVLGWNILDLKTGALMFSGKKFSV